MERVDKLEGKHARQKALAQMVLPDSKWRLAICVMGNDRNNPPYLLGEVIYEERLSISRHSCDNLERFAGVRLPIGILELRIFSPWAEVRSITLPSERMHEWIIPPSDQAIPLARWLLDDSSRHFLKYAYSGRFSETPRRLAYFRDFVEVNGFNLDHVLLDSSIVLELYGLRKAQDLDYLAVQPETITRPLIYRNDKELHHHGVPLEVLLEDPKRHFWIGDLRFISFSQLARFKQSRNRFKDRQDLGMMQALESHNHVALIWHRMLYELDLWRRRARRLLSRWVRNICGERPAKLYHRWRGR